MLTPRSPTTLLRRLHVCACAILPLVGAGCSDADSTLENTDWLLVHNTRARGASLEAYRVQNGSLRHVALGAGVSEARFSPDGRWLMYRREPGILWFRSVGDRFGTPLGLRIECDDVQPEDDSEWTPAGNAFVCLRRTDETDTLAVVSLDGDVPRTKKLITQKIRGELTASWSGANHVVATSSSNYTSELRLFQRAGEGWTERDLPATDDVWHVSDLRLRESVSPDGRWLIAYGRVPSDSGVPTDVLMAFALDGTRRRFDLPRFVDGAGYAPLAWRSADDAMLLTRTIEWTSSVAAWEPERGRVVEVISRPPTSRPIDDVADVLFMPSQAEPTWARADLTDGGGPRVWEYPPPDAGASIIVSPRHQKLLARELRADGTHVVVIVDPRTGTRREAQLPSTASADVAWSSDEAFVFFPQTSTAESARATRVELATGFTTALEMRTSRYIFSYWQARFSPDGTAAALQGLEGQILVRVGQSLAKGTTLPGSTAEATIHWQPRRRVR